MRISSERIDPTTAAMWLAKKNVLNRPMNQVHVSALAASMTDGSWVANGDTIVFSDDDHLLDGQHRLAAIIKSGVTTTMLIVRGVDQAAFATKDIGRRRTSADALSMVGTKNSVLAAATMAVLEWYDSGRPTSKAPRGVAPFRAVDLLKVYPDLEASVQIGNRVSEMCRPSSAAAAHYLFAQIDRGLADKFMDGVHTGADLSMLDPQLTLRARLLRIKNSRAILRNTEVLAMFIKAWNAYVTGQKIAKIQFVIGEDQFPIPKRPSASMTRAGNE